MPRVASARAARRTSFPVMMGIVLAFTLLLVLTADAAPLRTIPMFSDMKLRIAHDSGHPHDASQRAASVHFLRSVHEVRTNAALVAHGFAGLRAKHTVQFIDAVMHGDLPSLFGKVVSVTENADGEHIATGDTFDSTGAHQGFFAVYTDPHGIRGFFEVTGHSQAFRFETDPTTGVTSLRRMALDEHICVGTSDPGDEEVSIEPAAMVAAAETAVATRDEDNLPTVPIFNSLPGAKNVIYMDFDGYDASQSSWRGNSDQYATPFSTDSDSKTFNTGEVKSIKAAWEFMSEDFAPFDVTVTTDPAVFSAVKPQNRVRAAFTNSIVIGGGNVLGIAHVGSFNNPTDTADPVWIYALRCRRGDGKVMSKVGSHETGHSFGLGHSNCESPPGIKTTAYFGGFEGVTEKTGWGPIMGSGGKALSQWCKHEYLGAKTDKDQIATIIRQTGFRKDDHPNVYRYASPLRDGVEGFITESTDVDWFVFTPAGDGTSVVSVTPRSNLDVEARIYEGSDSTLLQTVNPLGATNAVIKQIVRANVTYYVRIDGVGERDPKTNGYSDYGSLGYYKITYSGPPAAPSTCGNDVKEPGEACDGGGTCCTVDCKLTAGAPSCSCGDGLLDPGEQCDDGNSDNTDCCSNKCVKAATNKPCTGLTAKGQCAGKCGSGVCVVDGDCCDSDSDCNDDQDCTSDVCVSGKCTNPFAPAGTSCSDNIACTTSDVCSGGSLECTGVNECAVPCGEKGSCCASVCVCDFGWHKKSDCTQGPIELVFMGAAKDDQLTGTLAETSAHSVFVVNITDAMTAAFVGVSAPDATGSSNVIISAAYDFIPIPDAMQKSDSGIDESSGNVDFTSSDSKASRQIMEIPAGRAGTLHITVSKVADGPSSYRIAVGDSKETVNAKINTPAKAKAKKNKLLIPIVVTVVVVLAVVGAVVGTVMLLRKRKASHKAPSHYDGKTLNMDTLSPDEAVGRE